MRKEEICLSENGYSVQAAIFSKVKHRDNSVLNDLAKNSKGRQFIKNFVEGLCWLTSPPA
jgi:hypothetical protein